MSVSKGDCGKSLLTLCFKLIPYSLSPVLHVGTTGLIPQQVNQ